ncbi:glucan biosynthesis protein G [Actibacterium atlanticum]|uniref:Glucan biosynthesis protein G n=1 Tax=Actibacterium atlanticum TaxID=1461693 RepID=A0A058ZKI9_9RHOB|nr:glucan biosynthesis protein G [Actibacterium atlanticum]KCV82139.1 glucan biosynthesis protein G [Actibacterium atlanticum]
MIRREFLAGVMALAASPALATDASLSDQPPLQLGKPEPFSPDQIIAMARQLAKRPYQERPAIPQAWQNISYDQYRNFRFDTRRALWADDPQSPLRLDVFAPGLYFPRPISVHVIEGEVARPLLFDPTVFNQTGVFNDLPMDDTLGYSGLRLRSELRRPGQFSEFAVFQGASYFRAIGTGDTYGLSARGLAIDTAEPTGEEFPDFTHFWLEQPVMGDTRHVVHALLDSPSCTGAYRFVIRPGQPLTMEVEATLFPRQDMPHVGIAPLTSMFQFDETNRDRFSDFRPAVHDSDGLLIRNGAGETLWRPLANPKHLQISAFVDTNPKGFGLMQRARKFSDFADLEALYHNRPSLWVEPGEGWGRGAVTLVEIPTDREIYDNIVAYWRPDQPLTAGQEHKLSYNLTWGADNGFGRGMRVLNTRIGDAFETGIIIAIDFEPGPDLPEDLDDLTKVIRSSAGKTSPGVVQINPETGGPRLVFKFEPEDATLIEFRAELRLDDRLLTETWLYRWTA